MRIRTFTGVALLISAMCPAQTLVRRHEVDIELGYGAMRQQTLEGSSFWQQGGEMELSAEAYRGFGAAMNISGSRVSNINGTAISLSTVMTTFGPRYTFAHGRTAWYGQALLGEAHGLDSLFPASGGAVSGFDTFALQAGGGVDVRLNRWLALRPVAASWVRTQFPNATTNVQNGLRVGAGMVFRLQR